MTHASAAQRPDAALNRRETALPLPPTRRLLLAAPLAAPWATSRAQSAGRLTVGLDPVGVLAEFGLALPEETRIRVVHRTADLRYLVLPERPPGTLDWSAERLEALVTRYSMIGTAVVSAPPGSPAPPR